MKTETLLLAVIVLVLVVVVVMVMTSRRPMHEVIVNEWWPSWHRRDRIVLGPGGTRRLLGSAYRG